MDYASWGTSWLGSWGDSWGPLHEVEEGRRPRANQRVKLRKVAEGRAWLTSAKSVTNAHKVRSEGIKVEAPAPVHIGGVGAAITCRATTRSKALRSSACSRVMARGYPSDTCSASVRAAGMASSRVVGALSDTAGSQLRGSGSGHGMLRTLQNTTTCERLKSRGIRNISDYELAAVALFIDSRR